MIQSEMAWTHCVSDVPMKDWSLSHEIHSVAVDDCVYFFGYSKSCEKDGMQVITFHPKTFSWGVIQPPTLRKEKTDSLAPNDESTYFVEAYNQMVYVCVGGYENMKGHEIYIFDTRSLQWSCQATTGDVPSGTMGPSTCASGGHVYLCADHSGGTTYRQGSYIWDLELSTMRWKLLAKDMWRYRNAKNASAWKMAWTHCVSDIPMRDWIFFRRMHAVTVDHRVYLFDYVKSRQEDLIQVVAFDPKSHTFTVIQPVGRREENINEILASKGSMVVINFAVAYKEKVYLCLGGGSAATAGEMIVFDTRRWRWSCVRTCGDVPSSAMQWRACACEEDGHVYAWAVKTLGSPNEGTYLWGLEMSSLRWKVLATAESTDSIIHTPRCIVPYKNRIYVLLERLKIPFEYTDDEVIYFDLATKSWQRLQPPGTAPLSLQLWMPFVYQDHLYMFLKEKRIDDAELRKIYDNVNFNEVVLRYSFENNKWEQVCFKGVKPPRTLHLASVVDNMAVFFSFNKKKAYILDFFPSLRSLCFQVVSKYHLDSTLLPASLKRELSMYSYSSDDCK